MKLIKDKEEIIKNCNYLIENIHNEEVKKMIYYGRYFLKYTYNNKVYFLPNKFISYPDNTISKYGSNTDVNYSTRCRNKVESVLGKFYELDNTLEREYLKFCEDFYIPTGWFTRKYIVFED